MTSTPWIAGALATILLVAGVRLWWQAQLRGRPVGMRLALLALHAANGLLFYLLLFPPAIPTTSPPLTVLTSDAPVPAPDTPVIVLPEAPASIPGPRHPDLATALRAHPGSTRITVRGNGLSARDLDAARGLEVDFEPTPPPRGLIALQLPERLRAGARGALEGQVAAVAEAGVEVLDPAGARVAAGQVDASGHFRLTLTAPLPGRVLYTLRVLDAAAAVVEELPLPLVVEPAHSARVLLLDGGASPENKYLKRWALDAGIDLTAQLALRPGARLLGKALALDAATLATLDLVILDERAYFALDAGTRARLLAAVDDGLGLLLRLTSPLTPAQRQQLAQLGFAVSDAEIVRAIRLDETSGRSPEQGKKIAAMAAPTGLNRRPLTVTSAAALLLLQTSAGEPLALWRARGTGRIALWWLSDTFKLVLGGDPATHGALWSDAVSTLARARSAVRPKLVTSHPRVGERQVVCGLAGDTEIVDAAGKATSLLRDPDARDCAAWWPERAGWHRIADAEWFVRERGEAPGLAAQTRRLATQAFVSMGHAARAAGTIERKGSSWPWFAAWLAVSALLWWLERRRSAT